MAHMPGPKRNLTWLPLAVPLLWALGWGFDLDPSDDGGPATYCTPQVLSRYPGGWPAELDYGVHWFGHGDASEKAVSGTTSKFYDPSKKTVIYFHGWTGNDDGWTKICKRTTTRCPPEVCRETTHALLSERWLAAGWNVGVFYWDQFADEDCTRDAEQKIWFDRHGNGFRWRSFDVGSQVAQYQSFKGTANSIADMCADNIAAVMGDYSGKQVRFVGHNIGAQLATRCAALLHDRGHSAAPQRLALLEPYFSKHHLWFFRCRDISTDSGLGNFAAAATAVYVRSLWDKFKVVTEIHKSSIMTENKALGVPNEPLEQLGALVLHRPNWCGGLGAFGDLKALASLDIVHLNCHHMAVFPMYFLSFGEESPPVIPVQSVVGRAEPGSAMSTCATPTAQCTDGQIREWVERQFAVEGRQKWTQDRGSQTMSTGDDAYKLEPSLQDEAALDPSDPANLIVMKTAMTSSAIFEEMHQVPWWLDLHSGRLQVIGLALLAGCLGLVGGALVACRAGSTSEISDNDSDYELAGPTPSRQRVGGGRERTLELTGSSRFSP